METSTELWTKEKSILVDRRNVALSAGIIKGNCMLDCI